MKKLLLSLVVVFASIGVSAQMSEPVLENGIYVLKHVEQVEGVSQNELYLRARTFLSDWAGPNSNSKNSIDFEDKESATVIVKGSYYLGIAKEVMYGWEIFADYIVQIKCKDGRFQVITKVPTMTFWWNAGNAPIQIIPYEKLYPEYIHKGPYRLKKYSDRYVNRMPEYVNKITSIVVDGITTTSDNDDF